MNKLLIAVLLLVQVTVSAQTPSVVGVVMDPTHAFIPGAQVTMEYLATKETKTLISDEYGRFVFRGVTLGKVRIAVTLPGFQKWTQEMELGPEGAQVVAILQGVRDAVIHTR